MPLLTTEISRTVALSEAGLVLGGETRLARFVEGTSRLEADAERLSGLLSIAFGKAPTHRNLSAIAAAATDWQLGDKALANLRLVFSGLRRLVSPADVYRLKAAEILFDVGVSAADLAKVFGIDPDGDDLGKYDPAQSRVPAGSGPTSGQWTDGLWSRFSAWLDEEVPVYDQDTGIQAGTEARARSIATNPLTVGVAGVVALFGGEAALPAGAAAADVSVSAPAMEEAETLTPSRSAISAPAAVVSAARPHGSNFMRSLKNISQRANT